MQINDLRLFVHIVSEKSITRAAENLFMSQSTASRRVVCMEAELGCPLLFRNTHYLMITPHGQQFYTYAIKILEEYDELTSILKGQTYHHLSVGFNSVGGEPLYLTDALKHLMKHFPETKVDLICKPTIQLYPMLKQGEIDCVIAGSSFIQEPNLFNTYYIDDIHFYALISHSNPLSKKKDVSLSELSSEQLLTISHDVAPHMSDSIHRILLNHGNSISIQDSFNSVDALITAVQAELGVGIITSNAHERPNCVPVLISDISTNASRMMLWCKSNLNPWVEKLVESFEAVKAKGTGRIKGTCKKHR